MKDYKQLLKRQRKISKDGIRIWKRLRKTIREKNGNPDDDVVIIVPPTNKENTVFSLLHLKDVYLSLGTKIFFCSSDPIVEKIIPLFSSNAIFIQLSSEEINSMLTLYRLIKFGNHLLIASLEEPFGRIGTRIIGVNGITKDEAFAVGALKIYKYVKRDLPVYIGEDKEILAFLKRADEVVKGAL